MIRLCIDDSSIHLKWCSCLHRVRMARTVRGCLTAWLQQEGTTEPENNSSVLQFEEQSDITEGKVIVDYKPGIDYEPEGPDHNDESATQNKKQEL